jgi:stage III sporulation protein AD
MDETIKLAAAALAAAVCAVTLRKQSPEFALVLGVAAGGLLLFWSVSLLTQVADFFSELAQLAQVSEALLTPLIKTGAIALVTHLAAALCKDAGEGGIASALEFAGGVAAICAALPLMEAVVETMKSLL